MNPLISVVLPVRNGGNFLGEAVDSILSQTFRNLELLLIDDHSTDAAISLLDKSDPRLKIIKSAGKGLVDACNTGFALGAGDFVARMDADDISLPARFHCQLEYFDQHPCIDISGCCGPMLQICAWVNRNRYCCVGVSMKPV